MGPRSFDRGEADMLCGEVNAGKTSMGPRSFDRGELGCCSLALRRMCTSMGPRSFDRGEAAKEGVQQCRRLILQWGRGHLTAESGRGLTWNSAASIYFNGAAVI